MEVHFTRHARNRMRLYEIANQDVLDGLSKPDRITDAGFDQKHAWKQIEQDKALRITYASERGKKIVITVTPKQKMPEV